MWDFLSVIAFVGSYLLMRILGYGGEDAIYVATACLMVAVLIPIAYFLIRREKIDKKLWVVALSVCSLGSITLVLHNDMFIKLKPTLVNLIIAAIFLIPELLGKQNLTKKMLGSVFDMSDEYWRRLNFCWVAFFLFEALLNVLMAFLLSSNDAYVKFKFFGLMGLSFIFIFGQMIFLRKFLRLETVKEGDK